MAMNSSTWTMTGSMLLLLLAMMGQVLCRPDVVMRAGGPAAKEGVAPEEKFKGFYSVSPDAGQGEEILGKSAGQMLDGLPQEVVDNPDDLKGMEILQGHEGPDLPKGVSDGAYEIDERADQVVNEQNNLPFEVPPVNEPGDILANPEPNRKPMNDPSHETMDNPVARQVNNNTTTATPAEKKILGMSVTVFVVVIILIIILVILLAFAIWYVLRQKKKKALKEAGANAEVTSVTPITTADGTKAQIVKIEPISEGGSSGSANP